MMNYQVKFSIATYSIENQKENIAILGLYDMYSSKLKEEYISYIEKNVDDEIILESSLGGGVGFPFIEKSTNIIIENHEDRLKKYLSNIKEDNIVMFSSNDRYELIVIYLLSLYAKEFNKKIIFMTVGVFKFEGRKMNAHFSDDWNKIENQVSKAILIDSIIEERFRKRTMSEAISFLFDKLFKRVCDLTSK